MRRLARMVGVCSMAAVAVFAGCMGTDRVTISRERAPQLDASAPWYAPGCRAKVVRSTITRYRRGEPDEPWYQYAWYCGDDEYKSMDTFRAMSECEAALTKAGVVQFGATTPSSTATPFDRTMSPDQAGLAREQRFPRTHTLRLVCLVPLVWVGVPVPSDGAIGRAATVLPYHPLVTWFSPTMKQGPTEAETVDADHRRIPVAWGVLTLTRRADSWEVGTEPQGQAPGRE